MEFNNLTQRVDTVIMGIQRHKTGMAAIAHVHGVNCRGAIGNRLPDANAGQLLAGPLRQGNGARIKTRMILCLRRNGFNQMYRELALRQMRNG